MAHLSQSSPSKDSTWYLFALPSLLSTDILPPPHLFLVLILSFVSIYLLTWALSPAGPAWAQNNRTRMGRTQLRGPRGLPVLGSLLSLTRGLPHRTLARLARAHGSTQLLAFSVGSTPTVVSTDPATAKEILTHPNFADRPLKSSARELMFARAIGFAPSGSYWRLLRRIASSHLFAPRRVAAHEPGRQHDADVMVSSISGEMKSAGCVKLRTHLQAAALNNIMGSVFGKRYDVSRANGTDPKVAELQEMVREGFELLGAFNWSDHLPWLARFYDPARVKARCAALVPRVRSFVSAIIEEHRVGGRAGKSVGDNADFVDVLLSLDGDEKLGEDDMIAVLWVRSSTGR